MDQDQILKMVSAIDESDGFVYRKKQDNRILNKIQRVGIEVDDAVSLVFNSLARMSKDHQNESKLAKTLYETLFRELFNNGEGTK